MDSQQNGDSLKIWIMLSYHKFEAILSVIRISIKNRICYFVDISLISLLRICKKNKVNSSQDKQISSQRSLFHRDQMSCLIETSLMSNNLRKSYGDRQVIQGSSINVVKVKNLFQPFVNQFWSNLGLNRLEFDQDSDSTIKRTH